jgi:subtilisin family serine protease
MSLDLPAWSEPFSDGHRDRLGRQGPWGRVDRSWAFGDGTGAGLRIAIVDSGVEGDHPAVGGRLVVSVAVERTGDEWAVVEVPPVDVVGHGTACAGIIHGLASEAELVSIRVLGADNRGSGEAFATGLEWAIEASGAQVVNLSLSSRSDAYFGPLHELADLAYFRNVLLVSAANNLSMASYPSLFASVVSVAAHDEERPDAWYYNPEPPVEFGAYGVNVDVAWRGGTRMTVTGNSFAAPHISGYAARIRAAHPGISPFET